jgi:ferritin-like metal-binding protein YciE
MPTKTASKSRTSGTSKKSASKSSTTTSRGTRGNSSQGQMDQSSMLAEFFKTSLKDIYYAEKALLKALPRMQKAATSEELREAFADHTEVTREQVSRCEQVFEIIGAKAQGKKCEAMEGLIKEAEEVIADTQKGSMTRDVALIIAAQKVEHYEIATYGGLAQLARTLGMNDAADLLGQTLEEEKQTDQLLTTVAENNINVQATEEEEED